MSDIAGELRESEVETAVSAPRAVPGRQDAGLLLGLMGLGSILLLWWALIHFLAEPGGLGERFSPLAAFASLRDLVTGSDLFLHVAVSLKRILVALGFALLIGVPVGLLVGLNRTFEAATSPAFQFLRMISPLSWMPIAVMVLGVGDAPVYFLLAFAAVWPILLNTAAGVAQLDRNWLMLARSLSATRSETIFRVVLPGIVAHILSGVRLAIGIIWIILVPAEMLGVSAGLGYFILDARDRLAYPDLMAAILIIGALGFALDYAARWLYQHWLHKR